MSSTTTSTTSTPVQFSDFVNSDEYERVMRGTLMYFIANEKYNCTKKVKENSDAKYGTPLPLLERLEKDEKFYSSWMQSYEPLVSKLFYDELRFRIAEESRKLQYCESLYPVVHLIKANIEDTKQLYLLRKKTLQEMRQQLNLIKANIEDTKNNEKE